MKHEGNPRDGTTFGMIYNNGEFEERAQKVHKIMRGFESHLFAGGFSFMKLEDYQHLGALLNKDDDGKLTPQQG